MVKQALFRWAWLILFVGQIVLYYLSYPHLAAITAGSNWPGGVFANIVALDILGGGCWVMVLLFGDQLYTEQVKGLRRLYYGLVITCTLIAIGVGYLNVHAWR